MCKNREEKLELHLQSLPLADFVTALLMACAESAARPVIPVEPNDPIELAKNTETGRMTCPSDNCQ